MPTGEISRDILGVWGWFGIDTPVVARFRPEGEGELLELTRGGVQSAGELSWRVIDAGVARVGFYGELTVTDAGLHAVGQTVGAYRPLTCEAVEP